MMENTDISRVRAALQGISYSGLYEVAERTGVPHGTLVRLKYGQVKDPRHSTISKLLDHLRPAPSDRNAVATKRAAAHKKAVFAE